MSARFALREATQAAHARLDALMTVYDLGEEGDYRRFLAAQAAAFLPVEQALVDAGATAVVPDFAAMRRSDALRRDMDALGLANPAPLDPPRFASTAALAGGVYVLEGSRLGAASLLPAVGDGLPSEFLALTQPPGRWRTVVASLERILQSGDAKDDATAAALDTFACFERAARSIAADE